MSYWTKLSMMLGKLQRAHPILPGHFAPAYLVSRNMLWAYIFFICGYHQYITFIHGFRLCRIIFSQININILSTSVLLTYLFAFYVIMDLTRTLKRWHTAKNSCFVKMSLIRMGLSVSTYCSLKSWLHFLGIDLVGVKDLLWHKFCKQAKRIIVVDIWLNS